VITIVITFKDPQKIHMPSYDYHRVKGNETTEKFQIESTK